MVPLHITGFVDCPHNLTKYETKQNSKIPIFQLFSEYEKNKKKTLKIKNTNILFLSWIGKTCEVQVEQH